MSSNSLSILGLMFYDPAQAFARIKDKPPILLPFLAVLLLSMAVTAWWIATVDFAWLREHTLAANAGMPPEARAGIEKMIAPTPLFLTAMISMLVGTPLIYALTAAYFLLAGKVIDSQRSFRQWFAFVCWTSVPRLLVLPLMALQIVTSHGQVAAEGLNIAALSALSGMASTSRWYAMASSVDPSVIWAAVLTVIGLKVWTGRSTTACVIVGLLPGGVIYGAWTLKIVAFG